MGCCRHLYASERTSSNISQSLNLNTPRQGARVWTYKQVSPSTADPTNTGRSPKSGK